MRLEVLSSICVESLGARTQAQKRKKQAVKPAISIIYDDLMVKEQAAAKFTSTLSLRHGPSRRLRGMLLVFIERGTSNALG